MGFCASLTLKGHPESLQGLHATTIFAIVFIDGEAGEHVNITYQYDKDNMYYFLKSPFSPISQIPNRGSHTPLYE